MEKFLERIAFLEGDWGWISQVFLVVFAALVAKFILRRFLGRLAIRLEKTKTPWDDALLHSMQRPLNLLIWLLGLTFAADIIRLETQAQIFEIAGPVRDVGVIAVLAWFLVRFVTEVESNYVRLRQEEEREVDVTTVHAVAKLLRVSVLITSVLVGLQTLGFSVSGVMAFGGIGGIVVGFAAKDLLANFFGGLMIFLDRPFVIGDWIRSPDREIEGTVEHIGWRLTRIRTFDKRPLYIPNSVFANIAVENPSRMTNRRIYETIGIRYDDAARLGGILEDVEAMLRSHPEIEQDLTLMVNFNRYGPSSLDFFVYTFTKTTVWTEFHKIKQDVLLKIYRIIEQHGAEVAFPTTTVHLVEEPETTV